MVLVGTKDISSLLEHASVMPGFDAAAWRIEGIEILQTVFEIDDRDREALVPPALHPTIPPAAVFSVARYPDSPVGPFLLAQVRVSCRAAALPRGFLLRAYASTPAAAEALGRGWGYPCIEGDVRLSRFHDRIVGTVRVPDAGAEILRVSLVDPEPINGGDIQYVATMNLANGPDGPVLVQVDADCTFHKAERGRPQVEGFDRTAWQAEGVDPAYPMNATFATVDGGFPAIRFVLDPAKAAVAGTRKLR